MEQTISVAKPWRKNWHDCISVDIDEPRFNPEICNDILQIGYTTLPIPDVIWASPPCDQYSKARTRARTPRSLALAIIQYFQQLSPELILWFIKSGDSSMLWDREVARHLTNYAILDYCHYNGPGYRNRTRTAHSANLICNPRPLCDPKTCKQCVDCKHKLSAQRGPCKGKDKQLDRCSLDTLHGSPRELTEQMLTVCQNDMWQLI